MKGSVINRKYEIFLTKFSNIRLNPNICNASWFFLRHALWIRWFKLSFVERPPHRTLTRKCKAVFFTKLNNIEANTKYLQYFLIKDVSMMDVAQSLFGKTPWKQDGAIKRKYWRFDLTKFKIYRTEYWHLQW